MSECVAKGIAGGDLVSAVTAMVGAADTYVLLHGHPEQAAAALVQSVR